MEDPVIKGVEDLWSLRTLYQILVGSAFVTAAINVTWFIISSVLNHLVRIINQPIRYHDFILGKAITRVEYKKLAVNIAGFYCLLVRHGTDEYISRMASDQERFEGRQQLRIKPIKVRFERENVQGTGAARRIAYKLLRKGADDKAVFRLTLPIHKRLGTQFKCFVHGKNEESVPAIISLLEKCEHVTDIKQSDSYHKDRVYFLLKQFFVVDTITPGVKNNFIFPE